MSLDWLKRTISSTAHFPSSPCFPWTSWQEWIFSSVSQTPSCECLGKTWGHWRSAVRDRQTMNCQGPLPNNDISLMNNREILCCWLWLGTLMMTKSDLVSSSECSKMWSGKDRKKITLVLFSMILRLDHARVSILLLVRMCTNNKMFNRPVAKKLSLWVWDIYAFDTSSKRWFCLYPTTGRINRSVTGVERTARA